MAILSILQCNILDKKANQNQQCLKMGVAMSKRLEQIQWQALADQAVAASIKAVDSGSSENWQASYTGKCFVYVSLNLSGSVKTFFS